MYRSFELFSAVRKVDLQFSLITLYTGLVYTGGSISLLTVQITLAANVTLILIEIAWEWLGDASIKTENYKYMYAFWCLSVFL